LSPSSLSLPRKLAYEQLTGLRNAHKQYRKYLQEQENEKKNKNNVAKYIQIRFRYAKRLMKIAACDRSGRSMTPRHARVLSGGTAPGVNVT